MKTKVFKNFLLTSLALGIWITGRSQQPVDSLYSYLEIAANNNTVVLQRYFEYEAALQKVPQVGSLPDPDVSLGVFLRPMEQLGGNQVADIRLMQMFPWFGVLRSAKDEMSLMANAKYESFCDAKLQVFLDVQRSWYDLHKVKQNIRISEKNIEILRTLERLAIVRFKAVPLGNNPTATARTSLSIPTQASPSGSSGMNSMGGGSVNTTGAVISPSASSMPGNTMGSSASGAGLSYVYRIQIEINDVQNSIELLKNQWNTIAVQFNSYLNRQPYATVTIPDTLIADIFDPDILALSDSALINNPMLGMLRYEQQSLEARKQMVSKMAYPMVGLGLNYSVVNKSEMSSSTMNGQDMIMPMVTATLPIHRKKYRAMQSETEFMKLATAQNYNATLNEIQTEYYQALQLYLDAQRRSKLYANQHQLASKSLDIMTKSFAASGSDLSDILRIRQQTLDYEYRQMEAVADYNTSIAWLKRLMAFSH